MPTRELKSLLRKDVRGPEPTTVGLPEEVAKPLADLRHADLVVAIPTRDHAEQIGPVLAELGRGLAEYYPRLQGVLLVADSGSTDGTPEAAHQAPLPSQVARVVGAHPGPPGRGRALRFAFEAAQYLQARVCLVFEPDDRSVWSGWVPLLAEPILGGAYDLVLPRYVRFPQDDPLNDLFAYPLVRTLFRRDVRQPVAPDYAVSCFYVRDLLGAQTWSEPVEGLGVDAWVTLVALAEGRNVAEAHVGPKLRGAEQRVAPLAAQFRDVVATLLSVLVERAEVWRGLAGPVLAPNRHRGEGVAVRPHLDVVPRPIAAQALLEGFRAGIEPALETLEGVLDEETIAWLRAEASGSPAGRFFPDVTWARIVADALLAVAIDPTAVGVVTDGLLPIFLARAASLVLATAGLSASAADLMVQEQIVAFEQQRSELLARWPAGAESRD